MNFSSPGELLEHPVMNLIVHSIENKEEFLLPSEPDQIQRFWNPVA